MNNCRVLTRHIFSRLSPRSYRQERGPSFFAPPAALARPFGGVWLRTTAVKRTQLAAGLPDPEQPHTKKPS
ncbi:hypothetical protein [Paenibacillus chitinolyticus]